MLAMNVLFATRVNQMKFGMLILVYYISSTIHYVRPSLIILQRT